VQGRSTGAGRDRPARFPLGLFAVALAVPWALEALLGTWPPRLGEPWLLRWARALAEHPTRTALALGLAFWALRPPRQSPGPRNGAGQGFGEIL
jgi:hypothetical protein